MSPATLALLVLAAAPTAPTQSRARPAERLAGRWVGQDGHDFVGPSSEAKPSGVQDVRMQLVGLPAGVEIQSIVVKGNGGDEWQFNAGNSFRAHLEREPGSTRADLYIEPTRVETGRSFEVKITLADGRSADVYVDGGKADPNLRMKGAQLAVTWLGQDGRDRAGPTAAVGPDGLADVVLAMENLAPGIEVKAVEVISGKDRWEAGTNPDAYASAEFLRDAKDSSKATLYLAPLGLKAGARIDLRVTYANGTRDSTRLQAGKIDPRRAATAPKLPRVAAIGLEARSMGQDGPDGPIPGAVKVAISGLPKPVVAAALADPAGDIWGWTSRGDLPLEGGSYVRPMAWQAGPDGRSAELAFAPTRDEAGAGLVLRLLHADGTQSIATIEGPKCDPALRSPWPGSGRATARPGDDLAALAGQGGTIRLSAGTYRLDRPLVLERSVTISGEPGAVLEFRQPEGAAPWTAAIKVHAGNTTLEEFAVRFAGPVRWDMGVGHGPAVIGTTDDRDPRREGDDPRAGLVFRKLDIEAPRAATSWEMAPNALRLMSAASGVIEGCRLRAGAIELNAGPWTVVDNRHAGTPPNTFAFSVISAHHIHDLTVARNVVADEGPSGKTWRFLVLTQRGADATVVDNTIADVGPRQGDPVDENAPEIILTEAYRLRFEGRPAAVAAGGSVIVVPDPQGDEGEPGDVLAVLAGPHAGEYRRVVQRIDRNSYLLDRPLPTSDAAALPAVSIGAGGFVGCRFEGNTIDGGERSKATGFVLVGHLYGASVARNTVRRCAQAFKISAFPTEQPVMWGWSHAPAFALTIADNRVESCPMPPLLAVEHGEPVKSSVGRAYLTARLVGGEGATWAVGDGRSRDPGELVLETEGATSVRVESGTVNGRPSDGSSPPSPRRGGAPR
jgi:hypothetical protein